MSAFARDDQGRLCAGGMPLGDIAASHGSPLYVYSGEESAMIIAALPPQWRR